MTKEPEYLRRLRDHQRQTTRAPDSARGAPDPSLTQQEQEAVRWARETAGTELRAIRNLAGARYAALLKVPSATGVTYQSLEGLPSRDALLERLRPGAGHGEEVVAAYEVRGGRPVRAEVVEGELKLRMGPPRPGAHPVDPEKMLRKAAALAAKQKRSRPDRTGKGRGR